MAGDIRELIVKFTMNSNFAAQFDETNVLRAPCKMFGFETRQFQRIPVLIKHVFRKH